jgi:AraC-like DNA-binding protein
MEYREFPSLSPYDQLIHCVWFLSATSGEYQPQPVVPDGRLELLVHRGDPFRRVDPDGVARVQDSLLVAGQLTRPIHVQPGSIIDVVGVRLNPLGASALLGLPLSDLTNAVVTLRAINPKVATALEAAASIAGSQAERAHAITRALVRSFSSVPDARMVAAAGCIAAPFPGSLNKLALGYGMSTKTFERRFYSEVGLSPKMYQRVVRFRRIFAQLEKTRGRGAPIATAAGYFDQAHMIRDFKQFTGTTPRRFFRPETPLASLLLSGLARDPAHREIDAMGGGAPGTFDPSHQ